METLADLVAAGRERDGVAIDAPGRSAPYTYRTLCTNAWKAGNLLGHYTHPGGAVAVVVGPKGGSELDGGESDGDEPDGGEHSEGVVDAADPVLAALGGTLVGATVTLTPDPPVTADALVRPAGPRWREQYPAEPGCSTLAYGGPPDSAGPEQFEAALWSENPLAPPEPVEPATPAVRAGGETRTHGDLLDAAATVVSEHDLDASSRVALAGDLREPAVLVAGVLAPLSVGATILLAAAGGRLSGDSPADDRTLSAADPALVVDGSQCRKY